jgi:hypothetical protein
MEESNSVQDTPVAPKKHLKIFVPQLYSIGNNIFNICYVQPDPLPAFIAQLQKLHVQGLEFVKIPINDKDDRLYIKSVILRFLRVSGLQSDYITPQIDSYNKSQTPDNRKRLLRIVQVTKDYCDINDMEFLLDPID